MDAPWLSEDEQRAWRGLAAVMLRLPAALESQLQRDSGLSHFEYWVLALLSEADGRSLQLRDLAAHANCSLSRLSHVVTRLERRGWVAREPVPGDNRSTRAVLSEQGYQQVVAAAPGHVANVRRLVFDGLTSEEVAALDRLSHRIADLLDERAHASGRVRPGDAAAPTGR